MFFSFDFCSGKMLEGSVIFLMENNPGLSFSFPFLFFFLQAQPTWARFPLGLARGEGVRAFFLLLSSVELLFSLLPSHSELPRRRVEPRRQRDLRPPYKCVESALETLGAHSPLNFLFS